MKRTVLLSAAIVACLAVGGWAKKPETLGSDQARITFVKGYRESLSDPKSQFYYIALPACDGRPEFARRSSFIFSTKTQKSHVVDADRVTLVVGNLTFSQTGYSDGAMRVTTSLCHQLAIFKSAPGHAYSVVQRWEPGGGGCVMDVVDEATGAAPPDLVGPEPTAGQDVCKLYGARSTND